MKKLLSVLLSLVFCASVAVTNPPVDVGENIFNPPQEDQYENDGNAVSPCEESTLPGYTGEGQG